MTRRNRIPTIDVPEDQIQQELSAPFAEDYSPCNHSDPDPAENCIVPGRVLRITRDGVWVDIGTKCPGIVPLAEWHDPEAGEILPPQPGDSVRVLLVSTDDTTGEIVLSHRGAIREQLWVQVTARYREGDRVEGTVTRVIRGGLLIDIGIQAFLPISQIDVRRPANLDDHVGRTLEVTIVRVDPERRSIIVSRRRHLVHEDPMLDRGLLATFEAGQTRMGVVKNIADFGAFVDLGGIDGLLHVQDMCWGRGIDPRQVVALDQQLEVVLLRVDRPRLKIALGLQPKWVPPTWRTATVIHVARGIAETGTTEAFPILADALEDAGCEDAVLLSHLRGPEPRLRGDELVASLTAVHSL